MQRLILASQLKQVIVARRKKLKLTQTEVAAVLDMSQPRYSQVESDPSVLSVDRLLCLTALLGLELHISLKTEPLASLTANGTEPQW